jgi:hypothetical protein
MNKATLLVKHFAHRVFSDKYLGSSLDVQRFTQEADNVYLVSFSRTGSHWLRMIIELYFERPLLTRTFYFPNRRDYLLLHSHDMDLQVRRENVIYLYRDPVDTIYSQLRYYQESTDNRLCILHWSQRYACHLAKWLIDETFTTRKTIIRYENLKTKMADEFIKVTRHFAESYDDSKIQQCAVRVSKEGVNQATKHDSQVVNLERSYQDQREAFRETQTGFVWDAMKKVFRSVYGDETDLFSIFPEARSV